MKSASLLFFLFLIGCTPHKPLTVLEEYRAGIEMVTPALIKHHGSKEYSLKFIMEQYFEHGGEEDISMPYILEHEILEHERRYAIDVKKIRMVEEAGGNWLPLVEQSLDNLYRLNALIYIKSL
jgi:hypothetical protein